MNLMASVLALLMASPVAFAQSSGQSHDCTPTAENFIQKVWGLKEVTQKDAHVTIYGEQPKKELYSATYSGKTVKITDAQLKKFGPSWQPKTPRDPLYGMRIEVRKDRNGQMEILKTGYQKKDYLGDAYNSHYMSRMDDFKMVLDPTCHLASFTYFYPDHVTVSAAECIKIRDTGIKNLVKNVEGLRNKVVMHDFPHISPQTANLVLINCRKSYGTKGPEIAKLLPKAAPLTKSQALWFQSPLHGGNSQALPGK